MNLARELKRLIFLLFIAQLIQSCSLVSYELKEELAPPEVRMAAFHYAKQYESLGAEYLWGGQDPLPKTIQVDCSGLVVRCYQYACADFGYILPFSDMTAAGMEKYCNEVSPEQGDLIFMGENSMISHVALFDRFEGKNVYFIDSTDLTGKVSEGSYPIESYKIIEYGRLLVYR